MTPFSVIRAVTRRLYVRGVPSLLWRARNHLRTPDDVYRLREGLHMRLSTEDYFQWMMVWGYYAPEIVPLLNKYLKRGDVCLDIGGHIGFVALHAAIRVGNEGKVLVVEPDPRARRLLTENVALSGTNQVTVIPAAVAAAKGKTKFHLASQLGWSTAVASGAPMVNEQTITVDVTTIDDLVQNELVAGQRVRFVKIDVEGFEVEALAGAHKLIAASTAVFFVEVNPATLGPNGRTVQEVIAPFHHARYNVYSVKPSRSLVHRPQSTKLVQLRRNQTVEGDILAVPAAHPE